MRQKGCARWKDLWIEASVEGAELVAVDLSFEEPQEERLNESSRARELASLIVRALDQEERLPWPDEGPQGTPLQKRVWEELRKLDRGETISYGEMAQKIGRPKAARAIGQAAGANPWALLVPCHRLVRADGRLGGFKWGEPIKRWLLDREKEKGSER